MNGRKRRVSGTQIHSPLMISIKTHVNQWVCSKNAPPNVPVAGNKKAPAMRGFVYERWRAPWCYRMLITVIDTFYVNRKRLFQLRQTLHHSSILRF